ncbi:Riboflavin transporter MCH5 [Talaromyces pinophilus]|nr:Riboflavin transporter MCH5 [Talaromyces pinophilus]
MSQSPSMIDPEKQIVQSSSHASDSSSDYASVLLKIPPAPAGPESTSSVTAEIPTTQNLEIPLPPDGGTLAWLHVFFGHMVFFNTIGVTNSYGVFEQYYTETLGHSPSTVGWIGGIQMFLIFFGGVFSGRATDAGYFRHCFVTGVVLQVLGISLTSLCEDKFYGIFLCQAVCYGLGAGLLFTPGLSVTSSYFSKKRTLALGIVTAGGATGGMVYPAAANALLYHSNVGFAWTMRAMALIMLITHIPSIIGYRPYIPPRSTGPLVEWSAFREKPFVTFIAANSLCFWGLYMAFFYLGTFARGTIHLSDSLNLVIVLNGVGVIGRMVPNMLAHRFTGITNMNISCNVICAICILCWMAIDSAAGLYAWSAVYGLLAGAAQALFPTMATHQTTDMSKIGTRTGMVFTIISFFCLTSPAIEGALIQVQGGKYMGAQLFAGSTVLVGTVCLVLNRWFRVGWEMAKI